MGLALVDTIAQWTVPYRLYFPLRNALSRAEARRMPQHALAAPNAALAGRHRGQRCFVLCNGPTVRQQNLAALAGEIVISVSSGYHHPDFSVFRPRYHCVPQITYGRMTEDDVAAWFAEMDQRLIDAELLLSATEEPLVRGRNLFPGRVVRYLFLRSQFDELTDRSIPDLSQPVPRVQSVAVMAVMAAMYMGFTDIYLLGTEHDHYKTGEYKYFFEPTLLKGKDVSTSPDGGVATSHFQDFHELAALWRQYRALREIATANGIRIWNATAGGELDEFPRVRLEEVVSSPPARSQRLT